MISIIIPTYNEQDAIEETVRTVDETFRKVGEDFEILVIDDGSTDGTADVLAKIDVPSLAVITRPQNRGYSASIKAGIRRSKGEIIGITDADGTYPVNQFPELLRTMKDAKADMVIGARTKKGAKIPLIRKPAKMIVNALANTLTGTRIPDNNSGMRLFTRELGERFMHLYPQRFSFTITITLAALTNDYIVKFVPIDYFKRRGKSTMSGVIGLKSFLGFLGLIIRIVVYFRPLRFFMWPSAIITLAGLGIMVYTVIEYSNITDTGLFLFLSGLQIGLFGLLADVMVRQRQAA